MTEITEINQALVDDIIPRRNAEATKNVFGRVLCMCGSAGYTGAAYFAAQGAVRMGSGIVALAVPREIWPVLAVKLNEPVIYPLPGTPNGRFSRDACISLLALAGKADAMLIGCGLARSEELTEMILSLLRQARCQIVLDADGINAIAAHKDILKETAFPVVLTPHAGEFQRLSGIEQATPQQIASFAEEYHCILLHKGHRTVIASPDGRLYRNTTGNPGMAKGGSGDLLSGMLVSLCGQGIAPLKAACAAAFLHGRAGDLAANARSEYGMTPTDMLEFLSRLMRRYNTREW